MTVIPNPIKIKRARVMMNGEEKNVPIPGNNEVKFKASMVLVSDVWDRSG